MLAILTQTHVILAKYQFTLFYVCNQTKISWRACLNQDFQETSSIFAGFASVA